LFRAIIAWRYIIGKRAWNNVFKRITINTMKCRYFLICRQVDPKLKLNFRTI
jgi:hypothetical protein